MSLSHFLLPKSLTGTAFLPQSFPAFLTHSLSLSSEANSTSRPAGGGGEECGAELRVSGLMGDESRATREPDELLAACLHAHLKKNGFVKAKHTTFWGKGSCFCNQLRVGIWRSSHSVLDHLTKRRMISDHLTNDNS